MIQPRSVDLEMLFDISHHLSQLGSFVIAGTFVMNITKDAFNRIGLRTRGWQKQKCDARMVGQPGGHGFGVMDFEMIHHHINVTLGLGHGGFKHVQQSQKQSVGFALAIQVKTFPVTISRAPARYVF